MHFEVRQGSVAQTQSGTIKNGPKAGKPYSIRFQEVWAILSSGEVRKVRVNLNNEQAAFAPGVYDLDDSSFTVGRFGDLGIGFVNLIPRKAAAASVRQAG